MTEKEWRRSMGTACLSCMPSGAGLMGLGAYLASGPGGMLGYTVGAVGVTLFVMGALLGKFAAWGPVPDSVRGVR